MTSKTGPQSTDPRRGGILRSGISLAVAAVLLAGCATGNTTSPARLAADASAALDKGNVTRSIKLAEQAVAADPRHGGYRVLLGNAYLRAGRFASARQAFIEARELGRGDGKVALSLALSELALGRNSEAVQTLNASRNDIPVADLGLALALAGDTTRAVDLLASQVRTGENTPKLRQNLALAYALDGRWLQARIMAAQDVPADQLDARMSEWAQMARPDDAGRRVASLLKVPAGVRDAGLPAALALANTPSVEQLAEEAQSAEPARIAMEELPAVEFGQPLQYAAYTPETAAPAPAAAPQEQPRRAYRVVGDYSAEPAETRTAPATRPATAGTPTAKPARAAPRPAAAKPVAAVSPVNPTHLVQLGSFASAEGAARAWQYYQGRNPQLRGMRNVVTQVTVNGRQFWRLQAGFSGRASADAVCGAVKSRGGACLVMAAPQRTQPGARAADMRFARLR